jgi:hypothetical protein
MDYIFEIPIIEQTLNDLRNMRLENVTIENTKGILWYGEVKLYPVYVKLQVKSLIYDAVDCGHPNLLPFGKIYHNNCSEKIKLGLENFSQ